MMFPPIRVVLCLLLLSRATNAADFLDVSARSTDEFVWMSNLPLSKDDLHVVVEIAIVCDVEFGALFHFDKLKILHYWTTLFWDVHQRFKSLPHSDISFWITSISVLTDAKDQPFIEDVRTREGSVSVHDVLPLFENWVYKNSSSWPNYDIAIAATGANIVDTVAGITRLASVCLEDRANGKVKSATVVAVPTVQTVTIPAKTVAHEIAHLLGAPHDFDWTAQMFNCWTFSLPEEGYIMGSEWSKTNSYLFSSCSDRAIAIVLRSTQARHCLKSRKDSATYLQPLIDTSLIADPFTLPDVSIEEQCQVALNDSSAYSNSNQTSCRVTLCRLDLAEGESQTGYLFPFDGSPCNNNTGRCFRGICETPKVQLMNSGTNQCLQNDDRFSANGSPKMHDCVQPFPTTTDSIGIFDTHFNGLVVYMLYLAENGNQLLRKHLTVDEGFVKFKEYVAGDEESFGWEMIRLEENGPKKDAEFILKHKVSQMCLMAVRGLTETYALSACSVEDSSFRWKFLGGDGNVLKYEDVGKFIKTREIQRPWNSPKFCFALTLVVLVAAGTMWLSILLAVKIFNVIFYYCKCEQPTKERVIKAKV